MNHDTNNKNCEFSYGAASFGRAFPCTCISSTPLPTPLSEATGTEVPQEKCFECVGVCNCPRCAKENCGNLIYHGSIYEFDGKEYCCSQHVPETTRTEQRLKWMTDEEKQAVGNIVFSQPPETEEWESSYPLNTFTDETKKELVEFVKHQIKKAVEEERARIKKLLDKKLPLKMEKKENEDANYTKTRIVWNNVLEFARKRINDSFEEIKQL